MFTNTTKRRLNKIDEIALHNGFNLTKVKTSYTKKDPFLLPEEKNSVISFYKNSLKKNKLPSDPTFLYYDEPILIKRNSLNKSNRYKNVGFDILGIDNSIAEAIIINTSNQILKEEGYHDTFLDINCTGDKDSINLFINKLFEYYKKNQKLLENCCKNKIRKKELFGLTCDNEKCQHIIKNAPKPINFLSVKSQKHFKEVLEYIEEMNIPYKINNDLVSEDNHYSKIIFEIKTKDNDDELILARGGRYDETARKIAGKRKLMAVGVSLEFKKINNNMAYSNKINKPKILIIQFGFIAKLKSFEIVDTLRKQRITVYQNLHRNKLTDQFDLAKEMEIPYILIIGQKEAMENEVIFRDVSNTTQRIIKIEKLPNFLKRMKIV